jgi:hypothetical protein
VIYVRYIGRLFILLGIIGIAAGIGGTVISMTGDMQSMLSSVTGILSEEEQAKTLCRTGEQLVTERVGSSTRNTSGTYGTSVIYYCVNAEGTQRDVTGEFVTSIMDTTTSSIFDTLSNSMLWTIVIVVSTFLLVIGAFMGVGGRRRVVRVNGQPINNQGVGYMVSVNGQPVVTKQGTVDASNVRTIQDALNLATSMMMTNTPTPNADDDIPTTAETTAKLQQLTQLYQSGMISREEYERTRQKILDDIV